MINYMYEDEYTIDLDPDCETAINDALLQHVRVNAIASKYDVAGLVELANTKISELLADSFSTRGYDELLAGLCHETGEPQVKRIFAEATFNHLAAVLDAIRLPDEDGNSNDHESAKYTSHLDPLALAFLTSAHHRLHTLTHSHSTATTSLDTATTSLQQIHLAHADALARESARYDTLHNNIEQCITTLQNHETCPNVRCDREFGCYIEANGARVPGFRVRCGRCHARCR